MTVPPLALLAVSLAGWFGAISLILADDLGWRAAFRWAGWGTVALLAVTIGIRQ